MLYGKAATCARPKGYMSWRWWRWQALAFGGFGAGPSCSGGSCRHRWRGGSSLLLRTSGQRLFRLPAGHRGWLFNCAYPLKSAKRIKGLVGTAEGPRAHKETLLSPRRPTQPHSTQSPAWYANTHTNARKHYIIRLRRDDGDLNVRSGGNDGEQKTNETRQKKKSLLRRFRVYLYTSFFDTHTHTEVRVKQ